MRRLPDDDELLGTLRQALVPVGLAPDAQEVARFMQALDASRSGSRLLPVPRRTQWRARVAPRGLVAAGVVLLASFGAVSGGVAADSLPGPLRSAAYDLGLPVSSPSLVAAESAQSALAGALAAQDRKAVMADVPILEQSLAALGSADRLRVEPGATDVLAQAAAFLAATAPLPSHGSPGEGNTENGGSAPSTPETSEPTGTEGGARSDSSQGSTTETSQAGDGSSSESSDTTTSTSAAPSGGSTGEFRESGSASGEASTAGPGN